jgi:putative ABC transport system substrate-binding protein
VPIVFVIAGDPVRVGLVANLNRPGGNVTGVVFTSSDLTAKQLGLLHELVPKSTVIAGLFDPGAPAAIAFSYRRYVAAYPQSVGFGRQGIFPALTNQLRSRLPEFRLAA